MSHCRRVLDESAIRILAEWRCEPVVTSLYLDVDGERHPRPSDFAPHANALFRAGREIARAHGDGAARSVDQDLTRIAEWLDSGIDRHGTRGLAAFAAPGHFEALGLPVAVRDQVAVGSRPDIAQLCEVLATSGPVLLAAVDSQASRMLRIDLNGAHDIGAPSDPVERQVDTDVELGSFEHRHEEFRRQHFRRVAGELMAEVGQRPVERVVLSGTPDAVAELLSHLGQQVAALVAGRLSLPPNTPEPQLVAAAQRLVAEERLGHLRVIVEELRGRASEGAMAVTGLGPTLEVLGAARAQAVIVEQGLELPGGRCADCGQLVAEGMTCPRCGGSIVTVGNIVAEAIVDAFLQHVTLQFCEPGALADVGHIGAFERRSSAVAG